MGRKDKGLRAQCYSTKAEIAIFLGESEFCSFEQQKLKLKLRIKMN